MSERYGFGPGFEQGDRGRAAGPSGPPQDMPAYGAGAYGSPRRYATRETPVEDHATGFGTGFGAPHGGAQLDTEAFGKPPSTWLVAAALVAVAAVAGAVLFGSEIVPAVVAWLAAGPAATGLLAVYAHRDTQQRARAVYDDLPQARIGYWVVAVVALAGILVSAWQIAQWVGRL